MKQLLLSTLFLFTLKAVSLGQSAISKGKVIDKNLHSLTDATILVEDHEKGTVSDNSGSFLMTKLPNGKLKLKISYLGYQTKLIDAVLSAGKTTKILINLEEGFVQGTEVVILEDRLKGQAKILNQKKLIIFNQQELAFNIYNFKEHIVPEFERIVSLSTIET
ncbi:MAG: carboxypeptidase-like regulatory domain-containing protein [Saprospiraceae bacterium]|nr:carboxypeptidase-like regulatory domain-containing protein [Saprospiraceae bacterium]